MQQPVQQDAERIDIRTGIRLGKPVLLRRGEALGTECDGVGILFRADPRDAEVDQHGRPVRAEDHVLGLDVPVDHRRRHAVQRVELIA